MRPSDIWLVILGGMAATYGTRLSFIALPRETPFPPVFRRGLRLVAPAVLAAILAPQVLFPSGGSAIVWGPKIPAAALAAFVGWRTRNAWLAIGTGMIALWLLQILLPV